MERSRLTIPKVWRSELPLLCGFFFFGAGSIYLSQRYPQFVISGALLELKNLRVTLTLPLFWLMPAFILMLGILRVYDVKYYIDSKGLEARVGILRFNQKITRVLYSDIRSAETVQTVVERLLDIGSVEVGTAATADIEVMFRGIAAPQEVQEIIQRERDRALQVNN